MPFIKDKECWKENEYPFNSTHKCELCTNRFGDEEGSFRKTDEGEMWICNHCFEDAQSEILAEKCDKDRQDYLDNEYDRSKDK